MVSEKPDLMDGQRTDDRRLHHDSSSTDRVWRIGSFPQNLAWIHVAFSEKPEFMDGRRTDDGRLRHDSSSPDRVKQS